MTRNSNLGKLLVALLVAGNAIPAQAQIPPLLRLRRPARQGLPPRQGQPAVNFLLGNGFEYKHAAIEEAVRVELEAIAWRDGPKHG